MSESNGPGSDPPSAGDTSTDEDRQYVLYPIFESHDHRTFEIARDIADGADASLLVLDLYAHDAETLDESRRVSSDLLANRLDDDRDLVVQTRFEHTDDPADAVITVARNHDTRLLVFDEHAPESLVAPIAGDVTDRISDRVHCDAVTVERVRASPIASVLVPIAGGKHSGLSISIGGAIARSAGAVLELFHVPEPDETTAQVDELFEDAAERVLDDVDVDTWTLEREDVADAIVEQSNHYDLTVVGEPTRGRLRRFVFGSITDDVSEGAHNTVLVSRRSNGDPFSCT